MKFDTKAAVPKLFFQPVRWLTDDEYETCSKKGQTTEAKNAITVSFAKSEAKPALAAPKEEEVDEPEKRKPVVKPNAVPAKKAGKLAEVIGEWETDDE